MVAVGVLANKKRGSVTYAEEIGSVTYVGEI